MNDDLLKQGYEEAVKLLYDCAAPEGFIASKTHRANYRRVWGRDGSVIGIAALLTGKDDLREAFLRTLRTLAYHQGPHGEIPSNVGTQGRISYGGTTGRVDADLWFVIGCHRYWQETKDERFLQEFLPVIRRIEFLLGSWEFNTKDLLYVPETGDWSDEYIQHGYVLYDQLLYWRALTGLYEIRHVLEGLEDHVLLNKTGHIRDLIRANYWLTECDPHRTDAYHPVMFKKGCEATAKRGTYWMPFFSPSGYGYRFDSMANILVSLLGIADNDQREKTDKYMEENIIPPEFKVVPAFHPVINPIDEDWERLQATFSYTFKNKPYEYHNGGLWPLLNGFYTADLAQRGKEKKAKEYLTALHEANKMNGGEGDWGFHEFIHGKEFTPGGTGHQGWSAAAAVIGHHALQGRKFL